MHGHACKDASRPEKLQVWISHRVKPCSIHTDLDGLGFDICPGDIQILRDDHIGNGPVIQQNGTFGTSLAMRAIIDSDSIIIVVRCVTQHAFSELILRQVVRAVHHGTGQAECRQACLLESARCSSKLRLVRSYDTMLIGREAEQKRESEVIQVPHVRCYVHAHCFDSRVG